MNRLCMEVKCDILGCDSYAIFVDDMDNYFCIDCYHSALATEDRDEDEFGYIGTE